MCGSSCGCGTCTAMRAIVSLLLLLLTVAAFIGVWQTHMLETGWSFGTTDASLAILAAAASLVLLFKTSKKMCPCNKACGTGCAAGCACGKDNCNCGKDTAKMN